MSLPFDFKIAQLTDIGGLPDEIARLDGKINTKGGAIGNVGDVPGLVAALAAKAPLASPAFTGSPSAPTPAPGDNSLSLATTAFVALAVAALVDSAPETLATLSALADALGNDPNLATTLTNQIAAKQDALTGTADVPGLDAALAAKQAILTALSDVPGLVSALAGKQATLAAPGDVPGLTTALAAKQDAASALRIYAEMPEAEDGADGAVALVLSDTPALVKKASGEWTVKGLFASPEAPPPAFDDTRMTATGVARNGPGLYYGFTAISGSGTVSVYDGVDASGTLLQQVTEPAIGVFQALAVPVEPAGIWVVQGARTVDYRID